jgi:hypothetical protein
MAANIPGFYFDVAKNRHFKITPNHLSPGGSKYSAEAIKRQRNNSIVGCSSTHFFYLTSPSSCSSFLDTSNQRQNARHLRKRSNTVLHRSSIFTHPFGGRLSLLRELGASKPTVAKAVVDSWARGLERRTLFHKTRAAHSGPDITQFVIDDLTNTFLYSLATLEGDKQYI